MAWTDTARRQHMRKGPRYPSDLRDGEWALIEPMFPAACGGGRLRTTCLRAVMDAILYIGSMGLHGLCWSSFDSSVEGAERVCLQAARLNRSAL